MSIQFNRHTAQSLWEPAKGNQGSGQKHELQQALGDHQLSKSEYESLKAQFLQEQPGGDFDQWLADALDGKLDNQVSSALKSGVAELSRKGSATESVSFALNDNQTGYETQAVARTYKQQEWVASARAADSNQDGRLDATEAAQAKALPQHLKADLAQGRAVLTYDDARQSVSYYPAREQPTLHSRYKDLKLTLDVDLKDVDGLGDVSKGDIQGTTSGSLEFDWNGPLIKGIQQAVEDETNGWVEADTRYVSDKKRGGPGYVIQARSGIIATRPIVIKSNGLGELYVESPGFGSSVRLRLGEKGLRDYALPKLRAMGFDMSIERKDDRIYLRPRQLTVKNVPLAAAQGSQGELELKLAGHTRFKASANGLSATFDQVEVNGSSGVHANAAVPDAAPDTVKGRIEAGLNYNVQKGQLDTEVVIKDTVAELSLDAREMEEQLYLPRSLAQKAGDHLQAKLHLEGSYRTLNGTEHKGSVHGFIELDSQDKELSAYGRFKTGIGESRLAVSALGINSGETARIQAQQGRVAFEKSPTIDLNGVQASARFREEGPDGLLTQVKDVLNGPQPIALQFRSLLTHAGLTSEQMDMLAQGREAELTHLLSSKSWLERLEKAVVQVQSDHLQLSQEGDTLKVRGENIRGTVLGLEKDGAENGTAQTQAKVTASARRAEFSLGPEGQELTAEALEADMQMKMVGDTPETQGTVTANARLQAPESGFKRTSEGVELTFKDSTAHGDIQARSVSGPEIRLSGDAREMDLTLTDQDLDIQAETIEGRAAYVSEGGSQAVLEADGTQVQLTQNNAGEWQLKVPDARARLQIDVDLKELRTLMKGFDMDALADLPVKGSQADMEQHLTRAGMSPGHAKRAASLLWKPELRQLFQKSDFYQALKDARKLSITTDFDGDLQMQARQKASGGQAVTATGQSHVNADFSLSRASGADAKEDPHPTVVAGNAQADVTLNTQNDATQLRTPELKVNARAFRPDGSQFGELTARAEALEAELSLAKQEVSSGEISGNVNFESQLDAAKIEQIQLLLQDFRDDLLTRLDALGLNRQQLENVLQAFGKNQLEALFKAFKPEDVAAISGDLGLNERQIGQLMQVLNQEPFQKLVQNLFEYSELLTDAKASFSVDFESQSGSWSRSDQQMMAQLHQLTVRARAESQKAEGSGTLDTTWTQEQVSYGQTHGQNQNSARLDWGQQRLQAEGRLKREANAQHQAESFGVDMTLDNAGGHLSREGKELTSQIQKTESTTTLRQQQRDGSDAALEVKAGFEDLSTRRDAEDSMVMQGFSLGAKGHLNDVTQQAHIRGEGQLDIQQMRVNPEQVTTEQLGLSGELTSQRRSGDNVAVGQGRVNLQAAEASSSEKDGVHVPSANFDVEINTHLAQQAQRAQQGDAQQVAPHASMSFRAEQGELNNLRAHEGEVTFDRMNAALDQQLKAPMARGGLQGELSVENYRSKDKVQQASAFQVDQINGKVYVKTEHLKTLLSRSEDARNVLETLSKRWANTTDAPQLFTNDEITLEVSEGQWQGDNADGNAFNPGQNLRARLNLPDLETRLGSTKVQLELNNLKLDSTSQTEIELQGTATFKPRQPEFNQSVQALLDRSLKAAGLKLKPEVHFVNGKFEVKIDRWYVDGLVNIDFNQDNIEISVDRAKLLHFMSAKKLAARLSESQINNYLMEVEREGNVLNLSLNEFSESLLHKDNLQIQSLTTEKNTLTAHFAYTDTKAYNQAYRQRQQEKLENRLFNDVSGQARSRRELGNRVEDLSPTTLRRVLKSGSPRQLDRMLLAAGGDADNLVRKALGNGGELKDYPVGNRAILAAYLARDRGLFERVDSQEKALIGKILEGLSVEEHRRFKAQITEAAYAKIQKTQRRR